jgi:regulator of replication initiation timing
LKQSPRSSGIKNSPRTINSPRGNAASNVPLPKKDNEELKILKVSIQQLTQKNDKLQKDLDTVNEKAEQDKVQLSKCQSAIDSLKEQNRQLMANTSKEAQIQIEQNSAEREKVSKLESQVENLTQQICDMTTKMNELVEENGKLKEESGESRRKRKSFIQKTGDAEEQIKQERIIITNEKVMKIFK